MGFAKKTILDTPIDGARVLVRADYNVPLTQDGAIADDYRIIQSLPTLKALIKAKCKVIICSHLGRPQGPENKYSLEPVAARLSELLGQPVGFVPDCVGDRVKVAAAKLKPGQVLMLENLRFYKEEESNDNSFARQLAKSSGADYFVQDGFGVVHRKHASTDAITEYIPSIAGLLLQKEVTTIQKNMEHPEHPVVAVVGGAKISDKILVIEHLVNIADSIVIGGAMANTFLQYKGFAIGKSKHEEGQHQVIDRIYQLAQQKVGPQGNVDDYIVLPVDVAVAPNIGPNQKRTIADVSNVEPDDYILDIGPRTTEIIAQKVQTAKTVIWNGTLGMAEYVVFAYSSAKLALTLAEHKNQLFSLIGGGDTADFVIHWDSKKGKSFGHVSTGGGASLELMAGKALPGVEALMDK